LRGDSLPANLHPHLRSQCGMIRRNICQRNVLLEEWRGRPAGYVPDRLSRLVEHLISIPRDSAFDHLQANQCLLESRAFRLLERFSADEVALLQLAEAIDVVLLLIFCF
jgi:hypothetical protein